MSAKQKNVAVTQYIALSVQLSSIKRKHWSRARIREGRPFLKENIISQIKIILTFVTIDSQAKGIVQKVREQGPEFNNQHHMPLLLALSNIVLEIQEFSGTNHWIIQLHCLKIF